MSRTPRDVPWREVEPLSQLNGSVEPVLTTVDKLRAAWEQSISRAPEAEFAEARLRNLRRHAIETGIIERLYELGNLIEVPLPRGEWKTQPNHVRRRDGSLLEYTPPEHVQSELERMIELYVVIRPLGESGAAAVNVYAETEAEGESAEEVLLAFSPTDTVTLLADDNLDERWLEVEDLLDRTLAVAIDRFSQQLS